MPRRNLVPLLLLAVLGVATAVFAVVGAASAPTATTIEVQQAAEQTFGSPAGANSWIMELVTSENAGAGTVNGTSQERIIDYVAPDRMVVYDVSGGSAKVAGVLREPAISCVLRSYNAMLQGNGSWTQKGGTYTRTESLADFSARVPDAGATPCSAAPSTRPGQVHQTAVVRSGYLIAARTLIVAPSQGTQGETLVFVKIAGVPVRTLK